METERAVAHHCEDWRLSVVHASGQREGQARPDRACHRVDHPPWGLQQALAPLRELAAIADEDGRGVAGDHRAERAKHFDRIELARRRRRETVPGTRPPIDGRTRLGEPALGARLAQLGPRSERLRGEHAVSDGAD